MAETAIRFRDDPWSRLPWLVPAALVLTLLSQIAFLSLLRQPANQSAVPRPVDVQIVELPVTPPAARPAPPAPPVRKPPPPPKPRVEPPPRPAPPQPEARVELPRVPTPPTAEEPVTQAPAAAATVPVPPAPAAPGTVVGPPAQAPVAALPPSRAPQAAPPSAPPRITQPARPRGGYQVRPDYPAAARRAGAEGTTVLRVHVRVDGTIDDVQVSRSAGYAALDEAAAAAVTRWRFEPARSGPDAVAVWVLIPVQFRLQNEN
jgi:protein TonB